MWLVRLTLSAGRWLLYLFVALCIASTARTALGPRAVARKVVVIRPPSDAAERYVAVRFARAYLTWSEDPATQQNAVGPFLSAAGQPGAGLTPAPGTRQQVAWVGVADERDEPGNVHDYTVAVAAGGAVHYIAVPVQAQQDGRYSLARYPALVGAPPIEATGDLSVPSLPPVRNGAVLAVLDRVLRNYIDDSSFNLAADLAPGAAVTRVAPGLTLQSVQRLAVEPAGGVVATVTVADQRGDSFTLAYEVAVAELDGRWEITRIGP
jgi:hypothetical protein